MPDMFSKEEIEKELLLTEELLKKHLGLSSDITRLSKEAFRQGLSFDEVCIRLDRKISNCKKYLHAYKEFLGISSKRYNGLKTFKCQECESLFDNQEIGSLLLCPLCNGLLQEGKFQENKKKKESKSQRPQEEDCLFNCFYCEKKLRIVFPFKSLTFCCPNCKNTYAIQVLKSNTGIYLIIPKSRLDSSGNTPPKKNPPIPEVVKQALHLFDLKENASFEEVKKARRQCMAEYHPDKVSHLGADIRRLAEEKTKKYNITISKLFQIERRYHHSFCSLSRPCPSQLTTICTFLGAINP